MLPVRWQSLVDFIVLAGAVYLLLGWAKQARAVRIALGIIGLHAAALVARNYDLPITSWVLTAAGFLAIAVLLVIFQPELRHAFMRLDSLIRSGWRKEAVLTSMYRAVADASFALARDNVGGLIVLIQNDAITELIQGGIPLGAQVSRELLEALFQKCSPLHDGAVVIDGNIATRAGAVLPLTSRADVPSYFGTRHRAAMGLSDRSDAVVVVVSEQRGAVTLMRDRRILEMHSSEHLAGKLGKLDPRPDVSRPARLWRALTRNMRFKLAALGTAAAVWGITLFASGTTVRTMTVPITFTGVPTGMSIAAQTAPDLAVQIRGNALLMDSAPLEGITASFDLSRARPGSREFRVTPANFDLPPGIRFERASPSQVSVKLVRNPL